MSDQNEKGHWVTIKGTHVFIHEGETYQDAFARQKAEAAAREAANLPQMTYFDQSFAKRAGIDTHGYDSDLYIKSAIAGSKSLGIGGFSKEEAEFVMNLQIPPEYNTLGDYYHDVSLKAIRQFTLDSITADHITQNDKDFLAALYGGQTTLPIQFDFGSDELPVPWENEEWGLTKYGLHPAGMKVAGLTSWIQHPVFGLTANIKIRDSSRETFWHEIGHVLPDFFVESRVAEAQKARPTLTGDLYDLFGEQMVKMADDSKALWRRRF